MLLLKTIQVLSIIFAIISLPLIFIGWGIFITIPMVVIAIVTEKAIKAKKNNEPATSMAHNIYIAACVLGGLGCGYGVYFLSTLGNADTTGQPSTGFLVIGLVITVVVTTVLIKAGSSFQNQDASSAPTLPQVDVNNLPHSDKVIVGDENKPTTKQ